MYRKAGETGSDIHDSKEMIAECLFVGREELLLNISLFLI